VADSGLQTPEPYDKMKIFTALLGLIATVSVVTVIADNQDLEKRQILSELAHDIESAVDCAGCKVKNLIWSLVFLLPALRSLDH